MLEALRDLCPPCGSVGKTVDHLFLHCEFPYSMWHHFLAKRGTGSGPVIWRLNPFAFLWLVWKERNDKTFKEASMLMEDLLLSMVVR